MGKRVDVVDGLKVYQWWDQATIAEHFRCSTRHVQDLEKKGLPNRGFRGSKEYPVPHALLWHESYVVHTQAYNEVVDRLDFSVALAEHRLREAKEAARTAIESARLRVRRRGQRVA